MSEPTVLLLGELAAKDNPAVDVVRRVGAKPLGVPDWERFREVFRRPELLAAIFPSNLPGFEELCVEVRSDLGGEDLPLIAVVPSPWDSLLERLFMFAIDDYIAGEFYEALEPKLLALRRGNPWTNLSPESGRVIIADPDRSRRVLFGRMLRRKGLGVEFAANKDEVSRLADKTDTVRLVIAADDLPPSGAQDAMESSSTVASLPWIICGGTEALESINASAPTTAPLRLFNHDEPPGGLLFIVNELLSPPPENVRKSPRVLYGAPATFRAAGSRHLVPAFTYNINRTGLFIRTLVPPPNGSELTIDFRPPYGEGRVRVYGNVVWRKECSQEGGPMVPAGMGVIYTRTPLADDAALSAGYEALLNAAPGRRTTNVDTVARENDE